MIKGFAIFGGSFDPIGSNHVEIIRRAAQEFEKVIVVPCGPRPDKLTVNDIDPVHRATMIDIALRGIENVEADFFDLENDTFTYAVDLDKRYRSTYGQNVYHVVGADLLPQIKSWHQGERFWHQAKFAVVTRNGYDLNPKNLPPNHVVVKAQIDGSSSVVRTEIYKRRPFEKLVAPGVMEYIRLHQLYLGKPPLYNIPFAVPDRRIMIYADPDNPQAQHGAELLKKYASDDPQIIVVLGGDGTVLRAVREHWRKRLPFFGINFGHYGFLANNLKDQLESKNLFDDLHMRPCPMLSVTATLPNGTKQQGLAFNDAWVQALPGDTARVEVLIDGHSRIEVFADGVLVATPAGSTGYARSMGAAPFEIGDTHLVVVGNNISYPVFWKDVKVPQDVEIELRNADDSAIPNRRRPIVGFADGKGGTVFDEVQCLHIRRSRVASASLLFTTDYDLVKKQRELWFPANGN